MFAGSRTRSLTLFGLAAILIVAGALRFWRLGSLPPGFEGGEAYEGYQAWRILTDPTYRPIFLEGNDGVPPLNAYANAVSFGAARLLGGEPGPTPMRATAAVFGVLGVGVLFGLGYEVHRLDPRRITPALPLLAAAALAVMRWNVHLSRIGIESILVAPLWAGAFWLLLRGWRLGSLLSFAGCGVLLAAAVYSYQGAWVIPLLMPPAVLLLWVGSRRSEAEEAQQHGKARLLGVAVAAGVATVLVAPFVVYMVQNITLLLHRPGQVVVPLLPAPGAKENVLDNLGRAVLMYLPLGNTGDTNLRYNLPGAPALSSWLLLPFAAGLLICVRRIANPAYSLALLSLVGLVLPAVISRNFPDFHRAIGVSAPTSLVVGIGLDAAAAWVSAHASGLRWRNWGIWAAVALLLLAGLSDGYDYFVRWGGDPMLARAFDVLPWQVAKAVADAPKGQVILYTPQSHASLQYAAKLAWVGTGGHGPPITFEGGYILPIRSEANPTDETYYVVESEDSYTGPALARLLPGLRVQQEWRDSAKDRLYARSYVRPAGTVPRIAPQHPLTMTIGDSIHLQGFDISAEQVQAGKSLWVQFYWNVDSRPQDNWDVSLRLLQRAGNGWNTAPNMVAFVKQPPGNDSLTTDQWQPGWTYLDRYRLHIPSTTAPGEYTLTVRLKGKDADASPADSDVLPAEEPGIVLGKVTVQK